MTRWWKHVAVVAAWLALGLTGRAQPGNPSPVGAARIPEPLGYTPEPMPYLVPGPVTPAIAPAGPPPSLNLPADHTGAFQIQNYPTETAWFASVGSMALKRQSLNHLPVAFTDRQNGGIDTGNTPVGIATNPDGSFNPFKTNATLLPQALNLNDVNPAWQDGARYTVGYLVGNQAFELTGFYNFSSTSEKEVVNQGRLFVPFGPPRITPLGFEGNNGLWKQADLVRAGFTSQTSNVELNYRTWDPALIRTELILGVRYFRSKEYVNIYTDDEFFVRDIFGNNDPKRAALYTASTTNNLVAFQFGGEYSTPLPHEYLGWIWLTGIVKAAAGPNFIDRRLTFTRGDGYVGPDVRHNSLRFSGLTDASAFVDFHLLERLRLRAGYTALWGLNFSTAASQVDYDFTSQGKRSTDHSTVFWHGPVVELQFLF